MDFFNEQIGKLSKDNEYYDLDTLCFQAAISLYESDAIKTEEMFIHVEQSWFDLRDALPYSLWFQIKDNKDAVMYVVSSVKKRRLRELLIPVEPLSVAITWSDIWKDSPVIGLSCGASTDAGTISQTSETSSDSTDVILDQDKLLQPKELFGKNYSHMDLKNWTMQGDPDYKHNCVPLAGDSEGTNSLATTDGKICQHQ